MSEYTQSGGRNGGAPAAFAVGSLGPMFEAAARTSNAYSKAYLAWQDELLRSTSTRLQRDTEFGNNLLKCDKWADAARLQQSWVASAVEDYVSQANKLFTLATGLTGDVARSSSEQAGEAAKEVGRYASAIGERAGAMADEGVGRFARSASEHGGAMAEEMRRGAEAAGQQAAAMAEQHRKAAEEASSAAKDRGQKRR